MIVSLPNGSLVWPERQKTSATPSRRTRAGRASGTRSSNRMTERQSPMSPEGAADAFIGRFALRGRIDEIGEAAGPEMRAEGADQIEGRVDCGGGLIGTLQRAAGDEALDEREARRIQ